MSKPIENFISIYFRKKRLKTSQKQNLKGLSKCFKNGSFAVLFLHLEIKEKM